MNSHCCKESYMHDMIIPYFVIKSAWLGDRARHVQRGELASQMGAEVGLFKAPDEL